MAIPRNPSGPSGGLLPPRCGCGPVSPAGRGLRLAAALVLSIAAAVILARLPWLGDGFFAENGPVEDAQALLLVAAGAVFALTAFASARPAERAVLLAAALVMFAMADREMDLRHTGLPGWLVFAVTGWLPHVLLGALALFTLLYYRGALRGIPQALCRRFAGWAGLAMALGFLLAGAGWPFDKDVMRLPPALADRLEESFEFASYGWFLVAAFAARRA